MIIAIAMNVSDHTALKKSFLLYISFTYSAWTFKGYPILYFYFIRSLIVSVPLLLNPIFVGLKTITIQYRDIQSGLYVFQKYRFCEDYTNLLWTQMFLLGFLETNLSKF